MTGGIARYARSTPGYIPCTAPRIRDRNYETLPQPGRSGGGHNTVTRCLTSPRRADYYEVALHS